MKTSRLSHRVILAYLPQLFVGLFFLSAAYLKWSEALFGSHPIPLSAIFHKWLENDWPIFGYRELMVLLLPYADWLAGIVIALQGIVGILLVIGRYTRLAGALIFFTQLNVLLATFHQLELEVLNIQALWFGVYFFVRADMKSRIWQWMTWVIAGVGFLHLYGRWHLFGDPFPSAFGWQFHHFQENVMSSWVGLKSAAASFSTGAFGSWLWASTWWLKAVLMAGLFTRFRLLSGSALTLVFLLTTMVWLNVWNCEGVMWVLLMFTWITHEYLLTHPQR